ncbi:MAG: hypothetical protein HRT72_00940 [Flavobacteriales bacterium]|nr:hypothetical protein [Flavobacteriales bacterium]
MMRLKVILVLALVAMFYSSCKKEGCTDDLATNYCASCEKEDNSCNYIYGCTDRASTNYDPLATMSDGSCLYLTLGNYETYDACSPGPGYFAAATYDMSFEKVDDWNYSFTNFAEYFTNPVDLYILDNTVLLLYQQPDGDSTDFIIGNGTLTQTETEVVMHINFKITDYMGYEVYDCMLNAYNSK